MKRFFTLVLACALLSLAPIACGDDTADTQRTLDTDGDVGDATVADSQRSDDTTSVDGRSDSVGDTAEEDVPEPIYPGFECALDEDCSTGICYGKATNQGVFEESVCQLKCIGDEDFTKYCNSDADCCEGTCCIGCGWREGLCVND